MFFMRCVVRDICLTLPNGTVIRGRYVIEGLLGKGGFSSVYLVRDKRVKGNLFALKEVIDPSKQERDRFTFECEVLRRLDHPSLPRVYHAFSDDAHFRTYMLMDYIEGLNLETLRKKQPGKRFALSQVMDIMAPIIEAIAYLHNQPLPIIHRDIKPANIIVLTKSEEAVLVDFSIAKEYEPDSTTTSIRHCSPGYGAPEQYIGETNTRTDIYGLGATFYALLSGIVPVDAFHRMMQLGGKSADPLEPLHQLVPEIPLYVSEAIERAMSINWNDRFATVEEFWQALNAHPAEPEATGVVLQPVILSSMVSQSLVAREGGEPSVEEVAAVPGQLVVALTDAPHDKEAEAEDKTPVVERKTVPLQIEASVRQPGGRETIRLDRPSVAHALRRSVVLVLIGLLLLTSVGIGSMFWWSAAHQPGGDLISKQKTARAVTSLKQGSQQTPTVSPAFTVTSTPVQGPPYLAGTYQGGITDTTSHLTSHMTLVIRQLKGQVSYTGQFTVDYPLLGSNPLTGTVDAHNNFSFTVESYAGNAPLYFYGVVRYLSGSVFLKGNYCSIDSPGHCNKNSGDAGYFSVALDIKMVRKSSFHLIR